MAKTEFVVSNHQKGEQRVYRRVPPILRSLLIDHPQVEGFVLGGSYANGTYKNGDDIDFDVLYPSYPDLLEKRRIESEIVSTFRNNQLRAHIRAPLAANALPDNMRKSMYEKHPQTPFVVRNRNVTTKWGL